MKAISKIIILGISITTMFIIPSSLKSAQKDLDANEVEKAQEAFISEGFQSFDDYSWDNTLCEPYDHSVGRCVGLYQDDRLSIYPVKDAYPKGDYGHAIIHGLIKFSKNDILYGEKNKWIGSTKYGEEYTLKAGYIFLPKSSFPPHILFSKECNSIRVKLIGKTTEIIEDLMDGSIQMGEMIIEYPIGYDHWYSRNPYLIESMCFVESRAYKGKYQSYLGPLKK